MIAFSVKSSNSKRKRCNILDTIDQYYFNILDEVQNRAEINSIDRKQAFSEIISDYLIEGEVFASPSICTFKSARDGISIDGYELSDEMNTLHVFISDLDSDPNNKVISKEQTMNLIHQAEMFVFTAITGQLQNMSINSNEDPEIYDLAMTISENSQSIRHASIHVLTNRICEFEEILPQEDIETTQTTYHIWDLRKLYSFNIEGKQMDELHIKLNEQFNESLRLIKTPVVNNTYECYIGYVSGSLLAKAYEYYGNRLMERNVRSYLQARGKINRGIISTAKNDPSMFMAYNNGLTTIAEKVEFSQEEKNGFVEISELIGWQIVNGGQTTASLYRAYTSKEDLSEIFVQIKLNVIKDMSQKDELISKISEYANSQNKISISDLRSNDAYQADLERLSYKTPVPHTADPATKWFYERTRGQYNVELNRHGVTPAKKRDYQKEFPKNQVITKTEAAKYMMSWEQFPHIVSKGAEANFLEFCNKVREEKIKADERYFRHLIAKGILFRETDNLVKSLGYKGYKANLVTYSIAAISFFKKENLDFDKIWNSQKIDEELRKEIELIISFSWKHITNPPQQGANVTQYCKKADCWESFQEKLKKQSLISL